MMDKFTQLEVRQAELERSAQKKWSSTTTPRYETGRAGGGERHIRTLDCGVTTSTGDRAGAEEEGPAAGEEQSTRGEGGGRR